MSDPRSMTLFSVINLSWFERGWVVQEAGLAKNAQLLWGDVEIGWIDLLRVIVLLVARGHDIRQTIGCSLSSVVFMAAYFTKHPAEATVLNAEEPSTLLEVLYEGKNLEFEDDRDRIYGLLGLSEGANARHELQIHYEISHLQVYFEFASWYISTAKDAELLDFVYHDEHTLLADVPSWVPLWNEHQYCDCTHVVVQTYEPNPSVSKRLNSAALAEVRGNILKVQGSIIDRIVWT